MNFEFIILIRSLIALFIAMIGALISIAASALLSVTIFDILPEAYDLIRPLELILGFLSGYLLFYIVSKYVYHICPACAATHLEERLLSVNYLMIVAVSLHSTMDGIGVAVRVQNGNETASIVILLAISIHKFPEGLALASVARGAGYSRKKAFAITVGIESTTFIGAIISIGFFHNLSDFWFGIILAHIGGGFVYLTVHAMLGEAIKHEKKSILVYAIFGFILIMLISLLLSASGI